MVVCLKKLAKKGKNKINNQRNSISVHSGGALWESEFRGIDYMYLF